MTNEQMTDSARSAAFYSINPMFGIWAGFWQRYYDNSMRIASIWMNLPAEIMATNKPDRAMEDRSHDTMRAYGQAVDETQRVMKDTADAALDAGTKAKARVAG